MLKDLSLPAFAAGVLSAFVGFASTFAVIIRGLVAVGASPAQAASGLLALSVVMGAGGGGVRALAARPCPLQQRRRLRRRR